MAVLALSSDSSEVRADAWLIGVTANVDLED